MPQQYNPSGQDWAPVSAGRGSGVRKAAPKTARELSMAKAAGLVSTEKRYGAGGNKSAHSGTILSARKLEEADDVGTIAKVDKSLSKAIMQVCVCVCTAYIHTTGCDRLLPCTCCSRSYLTMLLFLQARTAKKLTQKELATAINEKPQVVGDYEAGRAVPNPQIISKLERKLGVKLPRPGKSKAPPKTGAGGKAKMPAGKVNALTRGGPPKRR